MKVLKKIILLLVITAMAFVVSCSDLDERVILSSLSWEEQLNYLKEWGVEFPEPYEGEEDGYPNGWERTAVLVIGDAENSLLEERMPIAVNSVEQIRLYEEVDKAVRDYYRDANGNMGTSVANIMVDKPRLSSLSWDDQVKCLRDLGLEFPDVTADEMGLYLGDNYTTEELWAGWARTRIPFAEAFLDYRIAHGIQAGLLEDEEHDLRYGISYDYCTAVDEAVRKYYSQPDSSDYSRVDKLSQNTVADHKYKDLIRSHYCSSYTFVMDYTENGMPYPGCTGQKPWSDDRALEEIANDAASDLNYIGYNCVQISYTMPEPDGRQVICMRKGSYEGGTAGCCFMKLFDDGWIHKPEEDAPPLKYECELDPDVPWISEFYDDVRDMCYENPYHVYDGPIVYIAYQEKHDRLAGAACSLCGAEAAIRENSANRRIK